MSSLAGVLPHVPASEEPKPGLSETTRTTLWILLAAAGLGVLGCRLALLGGQNWGLNAALWFGSLVLETVTLARILKRPANPDTVWLVPALLLFAGSLAWHDSLVLKVLDVLCVAVLLSVAAMRTEKVRLHLTGIAEYVYGVLIAAGSAAFGMFAVLADVPVWKEIREHGGSRHVLSVLRGVLLAAPLLLVFGGLFAAADPLFQRLLEQSFQVNPDRLFAEGLATGVLFWGTAGFFHLLVGKGRTEPDLAKCDPRFGRLGAIEVSMVLGLLDALFLMFVMVQLRYLFGGDSLVRSAVPLTYADYARRGFFELTTVAALALPLLLSLHWLQDEATAKSRLFPIFGGLLVVLVGVVIISAMQRMSIYQKAYGLTELRVYTMAFMAWLSLVFGWFAGTVLPGRRERFTFGALLAGLAVVFGLHVINPDRLIVLTNAGRVNTRLGFDAEYAGGLSADAIPALVSIRDSLPYNEQIQTDRTLADLNRQLSHGDWRSWSWSRERAKSALEPLSLPAMSTYDTDQDLR
jgi:hypothetical protein